MSQPDVTATSPRSDRPGSPSQGGKEKRTSEKSSVRNRLNSAIDSVKKKIKGKKGPSFTSFWLRLTFILEEGPPPAASAGAGRRATAQSISSDREEIQRILKMNNAADITKSLPFNFPPPPMYPGDFKGKTKEEYKEYMQKRQLAEEWENALLAYKLRHRQGYPFLGPLISQFPIGDKAAMDSIVERLKIRLESAKASGVPLRGASSDLNRITEDAETSEGTTIPFDFKSPSKTNPEIKPTIKTDKPTPVAPPKPGFVPSFRNLSHDDSQSSPTKTGQSQLSSICFNYCCGIKGQARREANQQARSDL